MRHRHRLDDLAAPAHPRRAAPHAERHVGTDLGREREHAGVVDVDVEQLAHREQRGGGVGRTSAEPAARGDVLAQHEAHAVTRPARAHQQLLGGDEREVPVVGRHVLAAPRRPTPPPARPRARGTANDLDDVVRLTERDDQRLELVVAVGATAEDTRSDRLSLGTPWRGRAASSHAAAAALRATAAQSSSPSASARAVGATPAAVEHVVGVASPSTGAANAAASCAAARTRPAPA